MKPALFTTAPGLESIARAEVREAGVPLAMGPMLPGRVPGWLPEGALDASVLGLRTVHDVIEPWATRRLEAESGLDGVRAAVRDWLHPHLESPSSFRVRAERFGQHPYNRVDIERAVGGVFHSACGWRVRLEDPEVIVRADLLQDILLCGRLLTPAPLSQRPRVFNQTVGVSTVVAAAAARISGLTAPSLVLDPFCGAGTLLVEAAHRFPSARLLGGDWNLPAVEGARKNLAAVGAEARMAVEQADALQLGERLSPASVDLVLSNPPFGLRIGKSIRFVGFFRKLLRGVARVLRPEGRIVLLVHRPGQLREAAGLEGFSVLHQYPVVVGKVRPSLVVLSAEAHPVPGGP